MELADHLRALEERLLQAAVRKEALQAGALLAEDFFEFGSSGRVYSRAEILAALEGEALCRLSLTDFEMRQFSSSLALVTYRSLRECPECEPTWSLRNSLWEMRAGRWQMIFHQGTKIPAD